MRALHAQPWFSFSISIPGPVYGVPELELVETPEVESVPEVELVETRINPVHNSPGTPLGGSILTMPFMNILECSDGSFYVGSTWDLERRLSQHNAGEGAAYTMRRLPVRLVPFEEYERITDAFTREKQVQNWSRRKRIALIDGRLEDLPRLSRTAKGSGPAG